MFFFVGLLGPAARGLPTQVAESGFGPLHTVRVDLFTVAMWLFSRVQCISARSHPQDARH